MSIDKKQITRVLNKEKHKPVFTSRGSIVGKAYSIALFESSNLNCTEYTTITPITWYKNLWWYSSSLKSIHVLGHHVAGGLQTDLKRKIYFVFLCYTDYDKKYFSLPLSFPKGV